MEFTFYKHRDCDKERIEFEIDDESEIIISMIANNGDDGFPFLIIIHEEFEKKINRELYITCPCGCEEKFILAKNGEELITKIKVIDNDFAVKYQKEILSFIDAFNKILSDNYCPECRSLAILEYFKGIIEFEECD